MLHLSVSSNPFGKGGKGFAIEHRPHRELIKQASPRDVFDSTDPDIFTRRT